MRINKYVALATGMSRRTADTAITEGRVVVNGQTAQLSYQVADSDVITLDSKVITAQARTTIILNKPAGYVVSRDGQGSKTIYDLLPPELHHLKPIGRLDKDSSGLLLLTNDGTLAHGLTHPSFHKIKIYEVELDKPLDPLHQQMISDHGIVLEDGVSKLQLERLKETDNTAWKVAMHEGRNRQIRRTFYALGYTVTKLHRTYFGSYTLEELKQGTFKTV